MAQELHCRGIVDSPVVEDFPGGGILDAPAVVGNAQAVVILKMQGICLTLEARGLPP